MQEKKQPSQSTATVTAQSVFWGTIAQAILILIPNIHGVAVIFAGNLSPVAIAGRALLALNIVAAVASIVFILRRRQELSFGLSYGVGLALAVETVLLVQGFAVVETVVLLIMTLIGIAWLCPPKWKRAATIAAVLLIALIWIIELRDPSWRLESSSTPMGLGIGILLAVAFAIVMFFQVTKNSIRPRLIYGFLIVTVIPLTVVALLNYNSTRTVLTEDGNRALLSAASQTANQLDSFIENRVNIARSSAQFAAVSDYILLPAEQRSGSPEETRINKFIYARLSEDPVYISSVAVYDIEGNTLVDTATSEIGLTKADRLWFQTPIATGLPYASDLEFSKVTGAPSLYFSAPVRDSAGRIIGVIRTRYNAFILQEILTSEIGRTGYSSFPVLIDAESHMRLAHGTTPSLVFKTIVPLDPASAQAMQAKNMLPAGTPEEFSTNLPTFESALLAYESQPFFTTPLESADAVSNQRGAVVKMQLQDWLVVYALSEAEFNTPINAQALGSLVITLVAILVVTVFAVFIAQSLSSPITRLTQTAEAIAAGDINVQAKVETTDEIGSLASTFNRMTQQLRDFINTLESRVAERTRNLELAAEVGRTVSQVRSLDVMLTDAAELVRKQFDLYYVQVYLVNPSQTYLDLEAGTGQVGKELLERNHRLPFNADSINGRAAIERRPIIISDTTTSVTFKPNPLLPDTRSEMAIPLLIGEKVVGVLDLQSQRAGSLNDDVLPAFEALAGQIAIAIQNANFLAETEQARAEVEAQAKRLTRANWAEYLDAIHKPEETGFLFEKNQVLPMSEEAEISDNALVAPLTVTGETLGNLVVEMEGESPIARTDELLNTVARQVSQQIENLRLLDSAERYRLEAEEASRRLTREGWKSYLDQAGENLSYVYDLREVRPLDDSAHEQAESMGYALPLRIREETIGKLIVQGLEADDSESIILANAVAERLGTHIEALRQFEETQRGQMELDKRATELQAVAEISTQASIATSIQSMLQSVVDLTKEKFNLYHTHIYLTNEDQSELVLTAGADEVGRRMVSENRRFPIDQPNSLVARAARDGRGVISNDVTREKDFLPNPLLPHTHSELAVPIMAGDTVLGVFDIQGDIVNRFTAEDIAIMTTLSRQVAVALQNLRNFAKAKQQAERESMLNTISQKIQSATSVEAVLQIAARELGHALGAPLTIAQLGMKDRENGGKQLQPALEG